MDCVCSCASTLSCANGYLGLTRSGDLPHVYGTGLSTAHSERQSQQIRRLRLCKQGEALQIHGKRTLYLVQRFGSVLRLISIAEIRTGTKEGARNGRSAMSFLLRI